MSVSFGFNSKSYFAMIYRLTVFLQEDRFSIYLLFLNNLFRQGSDIMQTPIPLQKITSYDRKSYESQKIEHGQY